MRRYLQLMEQGLVKEAEEWMKYLNYAVYMNLKPRDGEVDAAKKMVELGLVK